MRRWVLICILLLRAGAVLGQTPTADVLGTHNLASGGASPTTGFLAPCQFCHAPHSGIHGTPSLWSQKLSTASYTLYTSPTLVNQPQQPAIASVSNLCLSCHDGTVAPGQTTPYGNIKMQGSMQGQDVFGTNLQSVHPFNFKLGSNNLLQQADNLVSSVYTNGTTGNTAVKLINNNVQCTSCHEPHVQNIDPAAQNFLVVNNSQSALCLACHISTPAGSFPALAQMIKAQAGTTDSSQAVNGAPTRTNTDVGTVDRSTALMSWRLGAHAEASNRISKSAEAIFGPYGDVRLNACLSCHTPHNGTGSELLVGPKKVSSEAEKALGNAQLT